eukprot:3212473-Amphidinium_carterae.1
MALCFNPKTVVMRNRSLSTAFVSEVFGCQEFRKKTFGWPVPRVKKQPKGETHQLDCGEESQVWYTWRHTWVLTLAVMWPRWRHITSVWQCGIPWRVLACGTNERGP